MEANNMAAMREALEFVKRYLRLALQVCGDPKYFAGCMNVAANRCSDALAEPPRNCDRFGSWAEARAEWWKFEVLPRVEGVVGGTEQPFEEWLFATATEQKGDGDGE